MNLKPLISQFWDTDKKLMRCIEQESDIEDIIPVDSKIAELIDQIREYRPSNVDSLKEKFSFFIELLEKNNNDVGNGVALEGLVEMLNRDFDEKFLETMLRNRTLRNGPDLVRPHAPNNSAWEAMTAFDLIGSANDRISIIDVNLHYVNTSSSNSEFYGQKPSDMIGRHVGEYIGESRFKGRAKRFFEKTLGGERQHYFHSLNVSGEDRIMSCQMLPLYETDGKAFGSVVTMGDVTHLVSDSKSLVLEGAVTAD